MAQANRNVVLFGLVTAAWVAYITLSLLTPISEASRQFGFNETNLALIRISIALPYLIAWIAGCYGGITLLAVAAKVPEREDKVAYTRIATGIFVLVGMLIATTLAGSVRNYLYAGTQSPPMFTILTNYAHVFGPLVGLGYIFSGSGHLRRGAAELPVVWTAGGIVAYVLFSLAYVWLIFTNPTRSTSMDPGLTPTYFLPDWAIVLTVALPFLVACAFGLLAVLRIGRYYRGVTGFLYKRSAQHLMVGVLFAIHGSILLQALLSLGTARLLALGIGGLLAVIYVFIAVQTLGFVFISLGARKLAVIEHVMRKYETAPTGAAPAK